MNYYRPGTGWAPQVWKQFDAEATRKDFARMKELGINCVRVFLTYHSFYTDPGVLKKEGLEKFDQFLGLAEQAGIYVHPTGPDHWEGPPNWGRWRSATRARCNTRNNSGSSLPPATAAGTSSSPTT